MTTTCSSCRHQFDVPLTGLASGMVIDDLWLKRHVASGNMGDIFVAKQRSREEELFLKVISPAISRHFSHDAHINFFTGLCLSEQAQDKHILSAVRTGKMKGHYCWLTPYVAGECLDKRVAEKGPLPEPEVLSVLERVVEILRDHWSKHQLLHGNIRPSNILIGEDDEVYLTDFGAAKHLFGPTSELKLLNYNRNVADYFSPEQAHEPTICTPQSDIYSLGATVYYLLAGEPPYSGNAPAEVLAKHVAAPPPKALKKGGQFSREVANLLLRMMSKDPSDRPQSWEHLLELIRRMPSHGRQRSHTKNKLKSRRATKKRIGMAIVESTTSERDSLANLLIAILAVVAGILVLGLGAILINRWRIMNASSLPQPQPRPQVYRISPDSS